MRVPHSGMRTLTTDIPTLCLACLLIGLNGCHRLLPTQHSADTVLHGVLSEHSVEHVVLFAVDGLEYDTLVKYLMQSPPRKPGGLHDLFGVRAEGNSLVF